MRAKLEKMNNFSDKTVFLKKRKGFSLLEVMIAMFVFSLIMIASVSVFVSAFHARIYARKSQKNLEEARTAMETVAKNIRMSTKVASFDSGKSIRMFNNSQGQCIAYTEADGMLKGVRYDPKSLDITDPSYPDCVTDAPAATEVLLSSGADVTFNVTPTDTTSDPKVVGKATVIITLTTGTIVDHIQTTTSFRDYKDILYN